MKTATVFLAMNYEKIPAMMTSKMAKSEAMNPAPQRRGKKVAIAPSV